jgi:hypothetical protein
MNQLIYHSRKIGKTNMYRLNTDLQAVLLLEKFVLQIAQVRNTQNEAKPISVQEKTTTIS